MIIFILMALAAITAGIVLITNDYPIGFFLLTLGMYVFGGALMKMTLPEEPPIEPCNCGCNYCCEERISE